MEEGAPVTVLTGFEPLEIVTAVSEEVVPVGWLGGIAKGSGEFAGLGCERGLGEIDRSVFESFYMALWPLR